MTLAADLCLSTLDAIVPRAGLAEIEGADGPFRLLTSPMQPEPVGSMRIFAGDKGVAKAVYVGITVEQIGLDSHMVFAFTPGDSAVPHFTLDSVANHGFHAFHLDLIPRVDLAVHLGYVDHCFTPLTETYESLRSWDGLTRAEITPRQYAMMSPWMCVNRATEDAFAQMGPVVATYRDQWFSLVEGGLPQEVLDDIAGSDLAGRDTGHRANLFSRSVDPVWDQITRLIGDQAEDIRLQLVTNEVPA